MKTFSSIGVVNLKNEQSYNVSKFVVRKEKVVEAGSGYNNL